MEHWIRSSHVSLHVNERKQKKRKEKRKRDFPLDPIFLIGWCGLTVDSSKRDLFSEDNLIVIVQ